MQKPIEEILAEREKTYGVFARHAEISQSLKTVIDAYTDGPRGTRLEDDQREALEMIAHKIARILNGDPNYVDSWVDICGYSQLVVDRLSKKGAV